ncbi:MAG: SUF system NifU family Fe-S cluster assembly protein [Burkholderiales bacterium]|nr:SUF system NifU family Fe-S cluster assembly protein [Burkholderiales bacterium]
MSAIYDDILLDHIRNARNWREIDAPDRSAELSNPLCGDTFRVTLALDGDTVRDAAFTCECCGISMASASVMTESVRGRTVAEARALRARFAAAVAQRGDDAGDALHPDHRAVLQAVLASPARDKCALLAWQALETALLDGGPAAPDGDTGAALRV